MENVVNPSGSTLPKAVCKDCGNYEAININSRVLCAKCKCGIWVIENVVE